MRIERESKHADTKVTESIALRNLHVRMGVAVIVILLTLLWWR